MGIGYEGRIIQDKQEISRHYCITKKGNNKAGLDTDAKAI